MSDASTQNSLPLVDAPVPQDLLAKTTRPLFIAAVALLTFLTALVGWSISAPLATTIHVSGGLISARPSFSLQPAFGGTLDWIGVELHDEVQAGQTLFRLNIEYEQASLVESNALIALAQAENDVIEALIQGDTSAPPSVLASKTYKKFYAEKNAVHAQTKATRVEAKIEKSRAVSAEKEVEFLRQRLDLLDAQTVKQAALHSQGLVRDADLVTLETQRYQVLAEIYQKENVARSAIERAAKASAEEERLAAQYRADLLARQSDNDIRLAELRREKVRLQQVISQAQITSPISGTILTLPRRTAGTYVPKGETIVEIAETLRAPIVRLLIPPAAIDQVRLGMGGRLTITSLPQREMPPIFVTVTAIAPQAEKDNEGNTKGYSATAEIENAAELNALLNKTDLRLSADMPVSVALTGRDVTFGQYLVTPFLNAFSGALQD